MTTTSEAVEIYCVKCRGQDRVPRHRGRDHEERPSRHPLHPHRVRHQEVPHRRPALAGSFSLHHPLDLGLTTHQLLSAMDGVAALVRNHGVRLTGTLQRARIVPPDGAAFRTAAVGRRPYISARTGPEGLPASISKR